MRLSTIELSKQRLGFSAGHFTIFSATEREALHGHNYQVCCAITSQVGELGLSFDYRYYKDQIAERCKQVDEIFLIPQDSPYLKIEEQENYYFIHFNKEKIPFLKQDVKFLPLVNISVEELSHWFFTAFSGK